MVNSQPICERCDGEPVKNCLPRLFAGDIEPAGEYRPLGKIPGDDSRLESIPGELSLEFEDVFG